MMSPACGSIWMPIIEHNEQLAAAEAGTRERDRSEERKHDRERDGDADDDQAVLTSVQKYGRWIASVKCDDVGWSGSQVGVRLMICRPA